MLMLPPSALPSAGSALGKKTQPPQHGGFRLKLRSNVVQLPLP